MRSVLREQEGKSCIQDRAWEICWIRAEKPEVQQGWRMPSSRGTGKPGAGGTRL